MGDVYEKPAAARPQVGTAYAEQGQPRTEAKPVLKGSECNRNIIYWPTRGNSYQTRLTAHAFDKNGNAYVPDLSLTRQSKCRVGRCGHICTGRKSPSRFFLSAICLATFLAIRPPSPASAPPPPKPEGLPSEPTLSSVDNDVTTDADTWPGSVT